MFLFEAGQEKNLLYDQKKRAAPVLSKDMSDARHARLDDIKKFHSQKYAHKKIEIMASIDVNEMPQTI